MMININDKMQKFESFEWSEILLLYDTTFQYFISNLKIFVLKKII